MELRMKIIAGLIAGYALFLAVSVCVLIMYARKSPVEDAGKHRHPRNLRRNHHQAVDVEEIIRTCEIPRQR
jgi:hypothetical protein